MRASWFLRATSLLPGRARLENRFVLGRLIEKWGGKMQFPIDFYRDFVHFTHAKNAVFPASSFIEWKGEKTEKIRGLIRFFRFLRTQANKIR